MLLGIMGNPTKPRFAKEVAAFAALLRARSVPFVYDAENLPVVPLSAQEVVAHDRIGEQADLILSFGGDGTLLRTAAAVAPHGKPILGVNLGPGLGYLTDVTPSELKTMLDRVLAADYRVEERMMIQASVSGSDRVFHALNDFVVGQPEVSRTSAFDLFIDSLPASTYRADGLIIASPTGSTAYSLSAGGPILEPTLQALIITPICPHTLSMRPLAVSSKRSIAVRAQGPAVLTADGEMICSLSAEQEVTVRKADLAALLVNMHRRDFYHVLRDKLRWGAAPGGSQNL